jgi:P-type Ca2+ transporter type 2C
VLTQETKRWHAETAAEAAAFWQTDVQAGLGEATARERLSHLGENRLPEPMPPSLLRRLAGQLVDVPVLTLLVAAALAAGLGFAEHASASFLERFGDPLAILAIVILNAALGLAQEARAEQALAALRQMTAPQARVTRDGRPREIAAAELVPGDLIMLEEGDKVAADVRLCRSHDLEVGEAALTGESFPVGKFADGVLDAETPLADRTNMVFMGTSVVRGRAAGVVINTGMHTEIGRIAGMLQSLPAHETPLEKGLNRFGKAVVIGCVAVCAIVFLTGLLKGTQPVHDLFLTAVSLAVAAIPEGLPAITTIVLALGTQRMARRNALVRQLPAVEGLGCAQIICTDKTGTLTQNAMTARRIHVAGATLEVTGRSDDPTGQFVHPDGPVHPRSSESLALALRVAAHALGADARHEGERLALSGDPTDAALRVAAHKGGLALQGPPETLKEIPFTSARRMATVVVREGGRSLAYVRGAAEVLLARSERIHDGNGTRPLMKQDVLDFAEVAASWGAEAMRVLGLAVREGEPDDDDWERGLTFVGLVGIVDPPRPEVKEAIAHARAAGIRTVMITGDHPATAKAIAREVGMWDEGDIALSGTELDAMDQQNLEDIVLSLRVVARATAAHKLRIVDALKSRGVVCAMTGDGVNDAPAVKSASIGVAMGRAGSEVTKEAADLVLADDNYATIVAAVEEGRAIYTNIRKFVFFLLSSNAGIVLVVFVAALLGWPAPLMPIQILWINLVTNGLPALALGVEPPEPDQMSAPPRDPKRALLGAREYALIVLVGVVMAAATLLAFVWLAPELHAATHDAIRRARTAAFTILSLSPMFHAFNCRSARVSNFVLGWLRNRALWGAAFAGVALQAFAVYVPPLHPLFRTTWLPLHLIAVVLALAALPLVIGEAYKLCAAPFRRGR